MTLGQRLLEILSGCNWHLVPLLILPLVSWFVERRRISALIQENQAGRFCKHGNNPCRCVPCAAEFLQGGVAGDAFAAIPSGSDLVDELEDELQEPQAVELAPAGVRLKVPLTIRIPDQGSNHRPEISLVFWTSAAWPGGPLKIGYMTSQQLGEIAVLIPPSTQNYHVPLRIHELRSIIVADTYGIDRVALLINGCSVIDATPETLFAAQHLVYGRSG